MPWGTGFGRRERRSWLKSKESDYRGGRARDQKAPRAECRRGRDLRCSQGDQVRRANRNAFEGITLKDSRQAPAKTLPESGGSGVVKPLGNEGDIQLNTYYGINAGSSLNLTEAVRNAFFGVDAGRMTTTGGYIRSREFWPAEAIPPEASIPSSACLPATITPRDIRTCSRRGCRLLYQHREHEYVRRYNVRFHEYHGYQNVFLARRADTTTPRETRIRPSHVGGRKKPDREAEHVGWPYSGILEHDQLRHVRSAIRPDTATPAELAIPSSAIERVVPIR